MSHIHGVPVDGSAMVVRDCAECEQREALMRRQHEALQVYHHNHVGKFLGIPFLAARTCSCAACKLARAVLAEGEEMLKE